ncbi:MAG: hypothetical protein M0030_09610 [Actinomycetota bacterium]|nr:hypothetical protein [Actinomycetota bacterium]
MVAQYSFQAQVTRVVPVGIGSDGLRVDLGFAGTVSSGPWAGNPIEGIDYLLIRPDGVGVIDARELITDGDGVVAALHVRGYVVPPFPLPKLPVLLDPGFTWPDVDLPMHGSVHMHSGVADYAGCNAAVYAFNGWVNMSRGSITVHAEPISLARFEGVLTAAGE